MKKAFATQRRNMIDGQIKPFSVADTRILAAFEAVAREQYVPEALVEKAYTEDELALGAGRFLVEPPVYARLLQEAALKPGESVLDIGCLMGYSAAILEALGASVTALDTAEWIAAAQKAAPKKSDIAFVAGELTAPEGQFDLVVVNGAVEHIPEPVAGTVKEGGRLAAFVHQKGRCYAALYLKRSGALHEKPLFDAFVPVLLGFQKPASFTL